MSEQLALANDRSAPPPSAWDWAREHYQGKKVARIIDLPKRTQAFVVIEEEGYAFLMDGSTHIIGSHGGTPSPDEWDEIIAEYDRNWHEPEPWPSA